MKIKPRVLPVGFKWLVAVAILITLLVSVAPGLALNTAVAGTPQPLQPNKVITDTTPTYRWTQVSGALTYELELLKEYNNVVVYSFSVGSSGACSSGICSFTPMEKLGRFGYRWHVRVSSATWSPLITFYIRANDDKAHHFTYELMYHWQRKSGGTWRAEYTGGLVGYLVSEGLPNKCSAAVHYVSSTYDNLVAETKVRITGAPSGGKYPEAYLALRMKNSVDPASQCWYGGYLFGYSNNGYYSIWKMSPTGDWTAIQPPTFTSYIYKNGVKKDWNILKVSAYRSSFTFYINDKLMKTFNDSTYSIGYFGFEMVNHGSVPTKFYADWISIDLLP